jgi:hypothetical protein
VLDLTLSREFTMADQSQDQDTKKNSEKKQPETVLLTAEELRAIAGGSSVSGGTPGPKAMVPKLPGQ